MRKIKTQRLRPIDPTLRPALRLTLFPIPLRRIKLIPILHSLTFRIPRGPSLGSPVEAQHIVFPSLHKECFPSGLAFDLNATVLVSIGCCHTENRLSLISEPK
jgi:hypothetical protein